MSAEPTEGKSLDTLLQKSNQKSSSSLLPDELAYLVSAFLPTQDSTSRSKAYLVLAAFCQGVRSSSKPPKADEPDPATDKLARAFKPSVTSRLSSDAEDDVLASTSFLVALFQVDWQSASAILAEDGILESIMDSVDLLPIPPLLGLEVAHLLGQASGHKSARAHISSQHVEWLEAQARQTKDRALRAAAAVAIIKLSRGTAIDATDDSTASGAQSGVANEDELVKLMKGLIVDDENKSSLTDAIEGLAYLSVDPAIKEALSKDASFFTKLFALIPRRQRTPKETLEIDSTLMYGVLVIVTNLCVHRPRLSDEQAQIAKLKRMAAAGKKPSEDPGKTGGDDPLDDDEHVRARVRRLITYGVLDVLPSIVVLTDSRGNRVNASRTYLSLVEENENRGKVLQSGGAKTLAFLIRKALPPTTDSSGEALEPPDLEAIQALAKLAITASPIAVFGPNAGAAHDTIRPFSLLLLHPASTLLQRFEALMALTNLSSASPETAQRIAKTDGILNKVELLLLEDHALVRRAAMELICNLIAGSDDVFERYGGAGASKSKQQVLLALSDVDDLPTRLAASGALATLTTAPSACTALFSLHLERHRVLPILAQLIDPSLAAALDGDEEDERSDLQGDPGLVHRGVICTRNFLLSITDVKAKKDMAKEAGDVGLTAALAGLVKGGVGEPVLSPTVQAVKWLVDVGKD
ncbi:hypothetical protein PLICRDRAFT_422048 [Plicaturopsis crispa FD-325 SS-3]|nr:hypothetical protein PLICRDRAFT_422048 [Plicaturopsis crispa FD-325 SS-3]